MKEQELARPPARVSDEHAAAGTNELNINDYVWIRLREKGRHILRERDARWSQLFNDTYGRLPIAERDEADTDGWSRWQLWSLIETFGPCLYLGCDPPFETTIRLTSPLPDAGGRIGSIQNE